MLVEAIRLIIVLASVAAAFRVGQSRPELFPFTFASPETLAFVVAVLGAGVGYILGGVLARTVDSLLSQAETRLARRHASEILAGTLGLLIGMVFGALVAWPVLVVVDNRLLSYPLGAFILVVFAGFAARFAQRKRLEMFGVLGVSPAPVGSDGGCLLDASAAIDGRVLALWKAGLLPSPLWVPAFILWELQGIADSADPLRRRRGQRGLEILTALREAGAEVRVLDEDPAATTEPDAKLVIVGRRRGLPIVTSDSNLAKAAELQGLQVLNLHALAELLRPPVLPGERTTVKLIKEGREAGQAIGYLDDGTMVVVERALPRLGDEVRAEVTSVLQNPTGRMVFAKLADEATDSDLREAT